MDAGPIMIREPGGATALCTLALLNCGRQPTDASVKKALDYLERLPDPDRTYSSSLMIMAFAQADPEKIRPDHQKAGPRARLAADAR